MSSPGKQPQYIYSDSTRQEYPPPGSFLFQQEVNNAYYGTPSTATASLDDFGHAAAEMPLDNVRYLSVCVALSL